MVVTSFPATAASGRMQVRTASPSTCMVQAPQSPAPQPNFEPFRPKPSRTAQSRGVSGARSVSTVSPFSVKRIMEGLPVGSSG